MTGRLRRICAVVLSLMVATGLLSGCDAEAPPPELTTTATAGTQAPSMPSEPATVDVESVDLAEYADELFALTNDVRAEEGLPQLEHSRCAEDQAAVRAEALVGAEELEHAPMQGVLDTCAVSYTAENLVRSDAEPAAVVDAWMGSPGHRENLMAEETTRLGIGCTLDGEQILCSQIFLGPERG